MDRISPERRSWNMSRIGQKNTKPEKFVRSFLFAQGVRYRCSPKNVIGKPDICIKNRKLALFVHGCFWHGHSNCKHFRLPKTNQKFWEEKITANINRDKRVRDVLISEGYRVFQIWECEIKEKDLSKLTQFIEDYRQTIK